MNFGLNNFKKTSHSILELNSDIANIGAAKYSAANTNGAISAVFLVRKKITSPFSHPKCWRFFAVLIADSRSSANVLVTHVFAQIYINDRNDIHLLNKQKKVELRTLFVSPVILWAHKVGVI